MVYRPFREREGKSNNREKIRREIVKSPKYTNNKMQHVCVSQKMCQQTKMRKRINRTGKAERQNFYLEQEK